MEQRFNPAGNEVYEALIGYRRHPVDDWVFRSQRTAQPDRAKDGKCGAGDLSAASAAAVQVWFGKHRDCVVAVDAMCKPIREKAPARWSDSAEGHVSAAARNIAQWIRKPSNDHETFRSGWK